MKSTVLVTIEHKDVKDLADVVASRLWSKDGFLSVQTELVEASDIEDDQLRMMNYPYVAFVDDEWMISRKSA